MVTIQYSQITSPVGPLLLGATDAGLAILAFGHQLPARLHGEKVEWRVASDSTAQAQQQLAEYFAGKRREFTLSLDLRGTEFQRRCWDELLRIPYGQSCSYADIARAVGSPNGFRAVGQANHHNPVAIVVPCHRVLAGGRALGGYGGGLPTKAFLLRLEGAEFYNDSAAHPNQAAMQFM